MWPQWTSMLTGWQWAALLAVPPAIVALYFLKLKRRPLEVPSTYLWQKTIEDLHVNSLWQRLRQSILLFLQLLLLAAVILALLRPTWSDTKLVGNRFILLIDHSASMSATDVDPNRLEVAKRRALEVVDQMETGDLAMVIQFSNRAKIVQSFTDDRTELRRRIEAIRPSRHATSLAEALKLARGLAQPARQPSEESAAAEPVESDPATLVIFSDGKFPDVDEARLVDLDPVFIPIGIPTPRNVAIAAFGAARTTLDGRQTQVFARLENFGPEPVEVGVDLYLDGQLLDADRVALPAGDQRGVEFNFESPDRAVLELRIDGDDDLVVDDRAWATISPPRRARVLLVTPGNAPLELALRTEDALALADVTSQKPEFLESDEYRRAASGGAWDLIVYDRCVPPAMPQADTWFIGRVPSTGGWQTGEAVAVPQVLDTDRTHPIMQFVELNDMLIRESLPLTGPSGTTVLVDASGGPLMVVAPRESFEDLVLGFEIASDEQMGTNWPLRPSFPVFVLNVLRYLGGGRHAATGLATVRPGEPIVLLTESPTDELTIETPSGAEIPISRRTSNEFNFADTEELGVYAVRGDGDETRRFAVNLFDRQESDVVPRLDESIWLGDLEVPPRAEAEASRREGWKALLLVAVAVLLVEWYIYNRRVYV